MMTNELTIYDNDACAYDFNEVVQDLAEATGESPEEIGVQRVWDYISDEIRSAYECERMNLDVDLDGRILCCGSLGLWWGRPTGCRIIDERNLSAVLDQACRDSDAYRVYFDGEEVRADDSHHDGTNHYTFREIREDVGDEELDAFLDSVEMGRGDGRRHRAHDALARTGCVRHLRMGDGEKRIKQLK